MKFYGPNERAYRLWRRRERRYWPKGRLPAGYDRSEGTRLAVALRDAERALFSWAGPNVKPDWNAPIRSLLHGAGLGVVVVVVVLVAKAVLG